MEHLPERSMKQQKRKEKDEIEKEKRNKEKEERIMKYHRGVTTEEYHKSLFYFQDNRKLIGLQLNEVGKNLLYNKSEVL